jgi:uncharacterized protein YecE (DUF72 family)
VGMNKSSGAEQPPGKGATQSVDVSDEVAHYASAKALADSAPLPAIWQQVSMGTAGWTDPSLLKGRRFYPSGASQAQARLQYYAQHFRLVEVDASYYTLLDPTVTARWVSWTPDDFVINVKAHASLTGHPVELLRLPAQIRGQLPQAVLELGRARQEQLPREFVDLLWQGFEASIQPLFQARRLGSILMQFPPWFTATRGNARHLEQLAERWAAYPIAAEFRHASWLAQERRERVFALLTRLGWSYVSVDEPVAPTGGVPPVVRVTQPALAVVRLHGQNVSGWRQGASVAERFNYLYCTAELQPWATAVRRLTTEARRVHVVFNNCVRDYAITNAKGLAALLSLEGELSNQS